MLRACSPVLEYAAPIWSGLPHYLIDEIESIQNRCMKILGTPRDNFKTLQQRRADLTIKEFQKIQNDPTNPCNNFIPRPSTHEHDLRIRNNSHMFYRTLKDINNLLSLELYRLLNNFIFDD